MRKNNKQLTTTFIICGLLLIGVVYAILQANLQINGTAKIQANTWDIHFDNIVVNENSVSIGTGDSAATIDPENNCKVDFEVTLSIPGDFYEFTIDVVNAGTIDGMIGELNKTLKVNNEVVSETPDYLNYSVTYSDGVEIEENHKIEASTTETYLVRLEFKTDIEELPAATTITTSLEPQYLQADNSAISRPQLLYDVFKTEASNSSKLVIEYDDEHKDSFNISGREKIYYWHAGYREDSKANAILEKWNIIFGGFCWQMFRTTDTGGVKLIYNGVPEEGKCNSFGSSIGKSYYKNSYTSPAFSGYMYNPTTLTGYEHSIRIPEGSLCGNNVNYENNEYTLVDTNNAIDSTHHYSCGNTTGTCSIVYYCYYYENSNRFCLQLKNGRTIEQALIDMTSSETVNQSNSTIKTNIDTWYLENLASYSSKLEDTIFCNDRRIYSYGGWNPDGGLLTKEIKFYNSTDNNTGTLKLSCGNMSDQFSMTNSIAQLSYPIGLLTINEARLIYHSSLLRCSDGWYWTMTPLEFDATDVDIYCIQSGGTTVSYANNSYGNVRPVVSLKPGTVYVSGDGSKNNPYIIE